MKYRVIISISERVFDNLDEALDWVKICLENDLETQIIPEWA